MFNIVSSNADILPHATEEGYLREKEMRCEKNEKSQSREIRRAKREEGVNETGDS